MDRHLHIISFIVPFPVTYGGVFDIYHKIVALHAAGIKIHLHCFSENNRREHALNHLCERVYYYHRRKGIMGMSFSLPYIVSSRMDRKLCYRLDENDYPVLIEGVHAAGWLLNRSAKKRKIILRLHNVEHDYYRQLFLSSSSTLRKVYYHFESALLKKFEQQIATVPDHILTVSSQDAETYRRLFNVNNVDVLPVFTGFTHDIPPSGAGSFCLYHGNLSVPENERAVAWLLNEVFNNFDVPFVIAGKSPSPALKQFIARFYNAHLVADPTLEKMQSLIAEAHCHVLPSFNITGVKLKIINALFHGRHCIVNRAAVKGSGLEEVCHIAQTPGQFKERIQALAGKPLTTGEIESRRKVLNNLFDEEKNCERLIQLIW
ncbi:MAG: glycosyltransferase [Chitinophagaceae bacterium]|nr:MAG: glycosyltransferase [Chitinophagaceae bacterium]